MKTYPLPVRLHYAPRCWCGATIINGHHCENGHIQERGRAIARALAFAAMWVALMFADAILAPAAHADLASGTPKFSCTVPTKNVDGSTLTDLTGINFYIDGALKKSVATTTSAGCVWQTVAGDIAPGNHNAQATAVSTSGGESIKSNVLPFVQPAPAPAAPSGLTVQ